MQGKWDDKAKAKTKEIFNLFSNRIYKIVKMGKDILKSVKSIIVWRGYQYYVDGMVFDCKKTKENIAYAKVKGSDDNEYSVKLNLNDLEYCSCTCPFAKDGNICKHMIAAYFKLNPNVVKEYEDELDYEKEQENYEEEKRGKKIARYINRLSMGELREILYNILLNQYEWEEYIDKCNKVNNKKRCKNDFDAS